MFFRTASAAFLLPSGHRLEPEHVLEDAGVRERRRMPQAELPAVGIHDPDAVVFTGSWPLVGMVWTRLDRIVDRSLLEVFFAQSVILDARLEHDVALDEDPLRPLADIFLAACRALPAEAAWLDSGSYYGDPAWRDRYGSGRRNREMAELVLAADIDALMRERLTLLWLNSDLVELLDGEIVDRDAVGGDGGCLVFGHAGARRWL